jgi:flagellar biosynthesis protein FliR
LTPEILDALDALVIQAQAWLAATGAVFARIGPMFALLPAFGERVVPMRIRLVLALVMTAVVAPAVAHRVPVPPDSPIGLLLFLASETLVGLLLAIGLRLMVMALQIAGMIAAQSTSLAQFFGGAGVDPQPAFSQVLVMAGLAALVVTGLPQRLAEFIVLSYDLFDPGRWPDPAAVADWGTGRVSHAFALAFSLSAPFVIASALYNTALGAINRAMPQLMVAFVGAPALTWGGLALMVVAAPLMVGTWLSVFADLVAEPALMVQP